MVGGNVPAASSVAQTSKSQTDSWTTYSDPEYGYEIKFPLSWFQSLHGGTLVLSTTDLNKDSSGGAVSVSPLEGSNDTKFVVHDSLDNDISREVISTLKFNSSKKTFEVVTSTTQTSVSQTADWKTYSNSSLGVEFKYPPASATFGVANPRELTPIIASGRSVSFNNQLTLSSGIYYNSSTGKPMTVYEMSGESKKEILIDGKSGIEVSSPQIGTIIYVPLAGDRIFTVSFAYGPSDASGIALVNQMLPTFKFASNSQTQTTIVSHDIVNSVYIKNNTELLFTDDSHKVWTVNYQSATGGVIARNGDKESLQAWLAIQKKVGDSPKVFGINGPPPGAIQITGSINASGVLVASDIEIFGG